MKTPIPGGAAGLALGLLLGLSFTAGAQPLAPSTQDKQEAAAMKQATGTFDVTLAPQTDTIGDPSIGRLSIDKQFHGDLAGTSKGQMLATRTDVEGSAGYVALERVTATLDGRSGSFSFQHSGTMNRGAATLTLTVVPDSATGGLAGLDGKMAINIVDGAHFYEFDYTFDDAD